MSRFGNKVDANQKPIVEALRKAGAKVQSLAAIGGGCPDLLVAYFGVDGVEMHLLEVKNKDGKDDFNESQRKWHAAWLTPVYVVYTPADALRAIGAME